MELLTPLEKEVAIDSISGSYQVMGAAVIIAQVTYKKSLKVIGVLQTLPLAFPDFPRWRGSKVSIVNA